MPLGRADAAQSPRRGGITLRSLARAVNVALAATALLACGALVVLTSMMHGASERARRSAEALEAAESVRVCLLAYGRASDLAYLTRDPKYALGRVKAEADLDARIRDARAWAQSPEAVALLDDGARKVKDYLASRHDAELRGGALRDVLLAATPPLEVALDSLDRLANVEIDNVARAEANARRWDRIANTIGVSTGALVLLGFIAIGLGMNWLVFRPLLALADAIDHFAAGNERTRVAAQGPTEFRRTAERFNALADRLERRRADLLTFLAGIAHDLRNPLAAMRMATQYLVEEGRPLPPEDKVRRAMALVDRQVGRLERMVGDFLDAFRIEGGHLELTKQRRDLRDLARDSVALYEPSSLEHRLVLTAPEEPLFVDCDAERIEQVLNNLVSNAIKYSPHGGVVEVVVARNRGEGTVSVIDHGIGIAEPDLDHVFEPFRRTAASREAIPGVGLGLSVSRRIIEAHGGRIEVESQLGVGSTFRMRLPSATPADQGEHRAPTLH